MLQQAQGIQAACLPLLLAATMPPVAAALLTGAEPFWQGALVLLAVFLWFVQRWAIFAGLNSSAWAQSSFRSLVKTLGVTGFGIIVGFASGAFGSLHHILMSHLQGTWLLVPLLLGTAVASLVLEALGWEQRKTTIIWVAASERVPQRLLPGWEDH